MIGFSVRAFAVTCLILASTAVPAADYAAEYGTSLSQVYGRYQHVLARREACGSAFPQSRGAYEKAFTSWRTRHRKLIDELEQRVAMMIHSASKDEKDYTRNIGKYEGAILQQREEAKQALLHQDRAQLESECNAFAAFLQGSDSDLEKESAEDLAVVRKRPLAKR